MTANPLRDMSQGRPGKATVEQLQEMADDLNRQFFVKAMGRHYHVGRRPKGDGTFIHELSWTVAR
jgi:hypothetical protein